MGLIVVLETADLVPDFPHILLVLVVGHRTSRHCQIRDRKILPVHEADSNPAAGTFLLLAAQTVPDHAVAVVAAAADDAVLVAGGG